MFTRRLVTIYFLLFVFLSTGAVHAFANEPTENQPIDKPGQLLSISQSKNFEILENKKANLNKAQKKVSTDLLELVDDNFIPPGQTREDVRREMQSLRMIRESETVNKNVYEKVSDELVYVYIYFKPPWEACSINSYVYEVVDVDEENCLQVAWVSIKNLESLAAQESVRFIRSVLPPLKRTGSVTSKGDAFHRADQLRTNFQHNGEGVKVGIISDGVDHWTNARDSGDLPADLNVLSNVQGGDEGTAMLEIVHDLAPAAKLNFHDCGDNWLAFNKAVDNLVSAGCKIICDDITWLCVPCFEDGIPAQHIATVLANNNIIYVSAAGNDAGGHYQGMYKSDGNNWHSFSGSTSEDSGLYIDIPSGGRVRIILQWDDQFGSSGNDYDLYLYDMNTSDEILAYSEDEQNGDDDPLEYISYTNNSTYTKTCGIAVKNYKGEAAKKTLEALVEGDYYPSDLYPNYFDANDSIFGHAAVPEVITVGAINVSNTSMIASYSSQGPVTIKYPSAETRSKPDICGMAGVRITGAGGFDDPFFGTSAAAPHVAAIASLVWSQYPSKTAAEIRSAVLSGAVDLGLQGFDYTYGYGRADAVNVLDTFPLIVDSTDPSSGTTNVPVDKAVTIAFGANVQPGSTYNSITMKDISNNSLAFTKNISGNKLTVIPGDNLAYSTQFLINIPTGALKNAMGKETVGIVLSFTTQANPDKTPPTVSASSAGGLYNTVQTVTLIASEQATIYYTTDGTEPTTGSSKYTGPISISATTTLKYMAVDLAGNKSGIKTEIYMIDTVPPTVSTSSAGGLYNTVQTVTLIASEQATIYYTTDGTESTTGSSKYTGPISISVTTTLKYMAVDLAGNKSGIKTEIYTIDTVLPTVSASSAGGLYNTVQTVTLIASEQVTIYYTTDGTEPTTGSSKYTGPISINATTTLKYIAVDLAGNKSGITAEMFTIDTLPPAVISSSQTNGKNNVSLSPTISVNFNESIQVGTNINSITVLNATYSLYLDIIPIIRGNSLILSLNSDLDYNTVYTVTIPIGSVKDAASNILDMPYSFSFTTAAPITGGIIEGNIILEGLPSGKLCNVTVLIIDNLGQTVAAATYGNGTYSMSSIPPGTYTVWFSTPKYLNKKIREASGLANVTLEVGDVNGDNIINLTDLVELAKGYNAKKDVQLNYNFNCDFNEDGVINLTDLVLLAKNYDKKGD